MNLRRGISGTADNAAANYYVPFGSGFMGGPVNAAASGKFALWTHHIPCYNWHLYSGKWCCWRSRKRSHQCPECRCWFHQWSPWNWSQLDQWSAQRSLDHQIVLQYLTRMQEKYKTRLTLFINQKNDWCGALIVWTYWLWLVTSCTVILRSFCEQCVCHRRDRPTPNSSSTLIDRHLQSHYRIAVK